ncbi:MAG TPA: RHS repeat-associated core domain-containing protein, partial [Anaerolineales bacterium]|nr:RHS repeat-associated core domain-containing protein [Anaerolineales bacterium]
DSTQLIYLRSRYYNPADGRFQSRDTWSGDYNRPLSLNRWMYVEGNPVKYTDPSGFCPEPRTDEDPCWGLLLQIESRYSFVDLESELSKFNFWTYEELLYIQKDLERFDQASKVDLGTLYPSSVKLKRILANDNKACAETNRYFVKNSSIVFYNSFDKLCGEGVLVHELGHYLDGINQRKYSKEFEEYVGAFTFLWWYNLGQENPPIYGSGYPPNRREDFAESLEEYVLLYTNYSGPDIGIVPGEKRWKFIEFVLDTGQLSINKEQYLCLPSYGKLINLN